MTAYSPEFWIKWLRDPSKHLGAIDRTFIALLWERDRERAARDRAFLDIAEGQAEEIRMETDALLKELRRARAYSQEA